MQENNMSIFHKIYTLTLCLFSISLSDANESLAMLGAGMPYNEAKKMLITQGWHGLHNQQIESSSLYANEIYNQGMTEVVDCISMELDGCRFYFQKKSQLLEIKTITRQLTVDSFRIIKR